jgi:2-hydroxychromene-2-carboxylate isomerase
MVSGKGIDFWFAIGSTYTYLSVMRIGGIEQATGLEIRWRPFSLRTLTRELNNVPFATKPYKAKYMWRDIERRAQMDELPVRLPIPYPLKEFDLANRVAMLGVQEGWCRDYVRATYRRWFELGQEPGIEPNLSASLQEVGQNPQRALERAKSEELFEAYQASTDEARKLGLFGAPAFVVDGELFWGDDRLEDAVSWALYGHVRPLVRRATGS